MSDLLPESVNLFLDNFETSLCLPILVIIVFCTAQFIFNHAFGIGYTIYQNARTLTTGDGRQNNINIMGKLKGMLTALIIGKPDKDSKISTRNLHPGRDDSEFEEETWDYCEEDTE
ncbi:hypothetical protein PUN28_002387 [Cardiocondyla obscurior]|uniref:Uncharacterized protein n=1 Tax=Cardiocondyla obscurior TaxID=286306 RepID=A0AAW2GTZ7_9HYME